MNRFQPQNPDDIFDPLLNDNTNERHDTKGQNDDSGNFVHQNQFAVADFVAKNAGSLNSNHQKAEPKKTPMTIRPADA